MSEDLQGMMFQVEDKSALKGMSCRMVSGGDIAAMFQLSDDNSEKVSSLDILGEVDLGDYVVKRVS